MPKSQQTVSISSEINSTIATTESAPTEKAPRGFAAMTPEKQREISSKGGKAAHAKGTAYEFTPEKAREAGRKGGRAAQTKREAAKAGAEIKG